MNADSINDPSLVMSLVFLCLDCACRVARTRCGLSCCCPAHLFLCPVCNRLEASRIASPKARDDLLLIGMILDIFTASRFDGNPCGRTLKLFFFFLCERRSLVISAVILLVATAQAARPWLG